MWRFLQNLLRGKSGNRRHSSEANEEHKLDHEQHPTAAIRLKELSVVPDDGENFDADRCRHLLEKISEKGAETVFDAAVMQIAVSLEDFFEGNRCKHSIAANVVLPPPYDTAESWYQHLKKIRSHSEVQRVLVSICMVEPYEGQRLGTWPYSDAIWIYSSLPLTKIQELIEPLEPDQVFNATTRPDSGTRIPHTPPPGSFPYYIWWD